MQKIMLEFNYKVNDKEARVQIEPNTSLADAKEVGYLYLKDIGAIEDQQKALAEQAKAAEEAKKAEEEKKKEEEKPA